MSYCIDCDSLSMDGCAHCERCIQKDRISTLKSQLAAAQAEIERLREALSAAAVRLELLTDRMRGCHEATGKHELLDEAEAFATEAREALKEGGGS